MDSKTTKIIGGVVALLVLIGGGSAVMNDEAPVESPTEKRSGGGDTFTNIQKWFVNGLQLDTQIVSWKKGELDTGDNEESWQNTTGKIAYVDLAEVYQIANNSSTRSASSSYEIYVATSSASSLSSDYSRPSREYMLIDGGKLATSSESVLITSTTTDTGLGTLPVQNQEYVVVLLVEEFACKETTGATCETSTSTNRGFDVEYRFRYHYDGRTR